MKSLQDFFTRFLSFESNVDTQLKEFSKIREDNSKLQTELAEAKATIEKLKTEQLASVFLKADLEARDKEIAELKAKAENVNTLASHKAAEITASQGQPPLPISPEANPANPKGPELKGLARTIAALEKK